MHTQRLISYMIVEFRTYQIPLLIETFELFKLKEYA